MPTRYPAPNERAVEAFLAPLTPVAAHVTLLAGADPEREPTGVMAEYVNDDGSLAAIAFVDHDAVNFVGGAIAAVEAATIREMNAKPSLHEDAVNSFRAVADGLGTSLNG